MDDNNDDVDHVSEDEVSEDDVEYSPRIEQDLSEPEDRAHDELLDRLHEFEKAAESAPPIQEDELAIVPTSEPSKKFARNVSSTTKEMKKGSGKKRGRGPTKGIKVTEPMYLEYNDLGQPCGRWRGKYGTHVGLCMRKCSILWSWDEVPEGLKKALWEDTINLFHIQPDEAKKEVFLSAVAERFRDFKSKLVSGWITKRRDRLKKKKMKRGEEKENEVDGNENRNVQPRLEMPYDIWDHITKDQWEAFVAKKTTEQEVENRAKASKSAKERRYHHHMGPKTYDEKRKEWISEGLYPTFGTSSGASTSTISNVKVDRVADWYCSLHSRDESRRRAISEPEVRKIADAVIGWKEKEVKGEFTPNANKDALYMVLGDEHKGRVKGKGGVRLGKQKAFGQSCSSAKANVHAPPDIEAIKAVLEDEIMDKVQKKFDVIMDHIGMPHLDLFNVTAADKSSHRNPSTPHEVDMVQVPDPPIHHLTEETPCHLLLPESSVAACNLIEVALGRALPPLEGRKVHLLPVPDDHWCVSVDAIVCGYEDFALPVPRPDFRLHTLTDAEGSFVIWPRVWVRFSDEVLHKMKKAKAKDANESKGKDKSGFPLDRMQKEVGLKEKTSMDKASSKASSPQVKPQKGSPLVSDQVHTSLSKACRWLHTCVSQLSDDKPIEVELDKNQFHYIEDTSTWVCKTDVREFLCGDMLNVSIIQVFMSALNDALVGCDSVMKVGWLCPQEIRDANCLSNQPYLREYLETSIVESVEAGAKFIIAPYLEDLHWLLLVICPSRHVVYQFDSVLQNPPRNLLIKSLLNSVMKKLQGSKGHHPRPKVPTWKSVKCAQQKDGVECGYYVMRFMFDLATSCLDVDDIEKVFNTPREDSFTEAEINEVRDKLAIFISDNFM